MKRGIIAVLGLLLATGLTGSLAAAEKPGKGDKVSKGEKQAELIKKYDKNSDGTLDKAEKKAMKEAELLKKYDKNGNGKLEEDEKALMEKETKEKRADKLEKKADKQPKK